MVRCYAKGPDRGPLHSSGIVPDQPVTISPVSGSILSSLAWFCSAPSYVRTWVTTVCEGRRIEAGEGLPELPEEPIRHVEQ